MTKALKNCSTPSSRTYSKMIFLGSRIGGTTSPSTCVIVVQGNLG